MSAVCVGDRTADIENLTYESGPGCSEEIVRLIPNSRLKLYPNSSHFFLNEHFDQVMADILAFLGAVEVSTAAA